MHTSTIKFRKNFVSFAEKNENDFLLDNNEHKMHCNDSLYHSHFNKFLQCLVYV